MSQTRTGRRRRSSSIIYQEPPESIEHTSDQAALPNLNANWVNAKGAWTIHFVLIIALKIFYDIIPGVSQETSWTLTNISYMFGSFLICSRSCHPKATYITSHANRMVGG
ncbi:unfolded protein response protein Orm1 [Trichophyton equinum CBS 127.97]|uniref:Unfolded protein response protein Orm1 n=1 Tax=Trichophyton equinum (strain ATCC MYA-4606 / CBS 127.97) TaxID=559882 RepID=F2PJH9_TRIEC|nr:unfolded protein response protein Orm1 [Trichophyton equinum CBS 127.97]